MEDDLYNLPIYIEDACAILRKNISKNERPYTLEAIKYNNGLIEEWKKTVLEKVCAHDGKIPSGKVASCWLTFEEGKSIYKYMELKKEGLLPEYNMKSVYFWRDFFENLTISEMKDYGWGVVYKGWDILNSYIRDHFITQKWELLYSQSDDPFYWERNSYIISELSKGKPHPFWSEEILKDVQQKVETILSNPIKPS